MCRELSLRQLPLTLESRGVALLFQGLDRACGCSPGAEVSEPPGFWAPPRPGSGSPQGKEKEKADRLAGSCPWLPRGEAGAECGAGPAL